MLVYQRVYPIVGGYSCVDTYQLVQDFATIHSISYDRILIYSNIVDDCEILHQLKTVVNIPLFCWGFNHPKLVVQEFASIHSISMYLTYAIWGFPSHEASPLHHPSDDHD